MGFVHGKGFTEGWRLGELKRSNDHLLIEFNFWVGSSVHWRKTGSWQMIVEKTTLDGILLIKLDGFEDHRGEYLELYIEKLYKSKGIDIDFVEDDISIATKGVIKGIHGDDCTWKLISCLHGKFYLVVINYGIGLEELNMRATGDIGIDMEDLLSLKREQKISFSLSWKGSCESCLSCQKK